MPDLRPTAFLLLALTTCVTGHSHVRATFTDSVAGQVRVETIGRDLIAIASYRDGILRGADSVGDLGHTWMGNWARYRIRVDHPDLEAWRRQLERMNEAAAAPGPDPQTLIRAASDFPFSTARRDSFTAWVGGSPVRAALLLDHYRAVDPGRTYGAELTRLALDAPAGDGRMAGWIEAMADDNDRDGALLIARSPHAGPQTARTTLRLLGEFSSRVRPELFAAVATHLAGDRASAWLLVEAADELPSRDEAPAMLRLLEAGHPDRELGYRVLRALKNFPSTDRSRLYLAAGLVLLDDSRHPEALARALGDLRSTHRLDAAERLATHPRASTALIASLLRAAQVLPSRDRVQFVETILRQPRWDSTIVRAAQDAVRRIPYRRDRARLEKAVAARGRGDRRSY